MLYVVLGSGAT